MKLIKLYDKVGIYIIALLTGSVFAFFAPLMISGGNIVNILTQASITAIAAAGMTFAITSGGFDLSIGATLALTTCIIGKVIQAYGLLNAVLLSLAVGVLVGLINGLIITKLKIQTFVATLATMIIIRGIAFLVTNGRDVLFTDAQEIKMFTMSKVLGIQTPIVMMALVFIIFYVLYKFTPLGVYVRGIGCNEATARISGIRVDRTLIMIFVLTAVTAVISGIIQASQTLVGNGRYGASFALDVITATILGGTSLNGGKGNLFGSLVAAIMLSIINNGLNLLNVSVFYQGLTTGCILIFALMLNGFKEILSERI